MTISRITADHYGHQQGDDCLIRVAAELAAMLQHTPTDLLARYGGEEFAAILPDTDAAQALRMAEAIRERAAELRIAHAKTDHEVKHITVSIGIATQHPQQQLPISALILTPPTGPCTLAKGAGRNRVMVQPL